MVVIDVFAKMRGQAPQGVSAYDADYVAVGYAKRLADHYGVAVVLVHHVRKAASEDFLTEVSGTNGIAGAADATLVLKRARGQADGILHVTGRDVDEAEYALQFQPPPEPGTCWTGPPPTTPFGDTRAAILAVTCGQPRREAQGHRGRAPAGRRGHGPPHLLPHGRDGQLTKDGSGRYYPDTEPRTQPAPEVSQLSDCPVTSSDQHEQPGQSELELSGLSGPEPPTHVPSRGGPRDPRPVPSRAAPASAPLPDSGRHAAAASSRRTVIYDLIRAGRLRSVNEGRTPAHPRFGHSPSTSRCWSARQE